MGKTTGKGFLRVTIGKKIGLGYFISALLVFGIGFIGFINLRIISEQSMELKESGEILIESEKQNFDHSIESIRELVQTAKSAVNQSAAVKENLVANVKETFSTIAEITANINSINVQVMNLNDAILKSSGVLEKIHTHIQSLTDQIENQSMAVEESSASVAEMAD